MFQPFKNPARKTATMSLDSSPHIDEHRQDTLALGDVMPLSQIVTLRPSRMRFPLGSLFRTRLTESPFPVLPQARIGQRPLAAVPSPTSCALPHAGFTFRVPQVGLATVLAILCIALTCALTESARATEKLRVGKSAPSSIMMSPLNVGVAKGIFQANGLDVEIIDFYGAARAHQAMAAGALDLLLGSGPDLAFIAKGSPEIGVAAISNSPDLGYIVAYDAPMQTIGDLKGKKIGISTAGSLTAWLANELALIEGWGPNGIVPVAIGNQFAGEIAAMKTGNVDAFIETNALGLQLEETKSGRLLAPVSTYVGDLVANAIFASNDIVKTNPAAVKLFVKSWFETIAFMRQNKQEAVPLVAKVTGYDLDLQNRDYDLTMPDFSSDGRFSPAALNTLAESFVQLKVLDAQPDMSKLVTEQFLPSH